MTNKKIAFLVHDYTCVGGVERVTLSLISALKDRGIKTDLLLSNFNTNGSPQLNFSTTLKTLVLQPTPSENFEKNLQIALKENKINILIYQGDNMTYSLKIQSALKNIDCKGILQYHGSPYAYLKKRVHLSDIKEKPIFLFKKLWNLIQFPFKKSKLKKVIKGADAFVCVSNGGANEIMGLYPNLNLKHNRLSVIYNLLTFKLIDFDKAYFQKKKNIIIYVSRLERKHKNSMMVVKVWNLLFAKLPNWELHILGDGTLKNEMQKFTKINNIERCVFHGLVFDVESHFEKSKITLLTSDCEGLPTVLLEASAYCNAIVSTKSDGGVIDIVPTKDHGILVKMNDTHAMAKGILNLAQNEKSIERKIIKNQENLKNNFKSSSIINNWINLFETF